MAIMTTSELLAKSRSMNIARAKLCSQAQAPALAPMQKMPQSSNLLLVLKMKLAKIIGTMA